MNKEQDLRLRIQQIDKYLELGRRLEAILDDPAVLEPTGSVLELLSDVRESYSTQIESEGTMEEVRAERDKNRQKYVTKYAGILGGEDAARKDFDTPAENAKKEGYVHLAKAISAGMFACIVAPFSREFSKSLLELKEEYFRISKNYFRIISLNKEASKINDSTLIAKHDIEFAEAYLAESLKVKNGLPEEAVAKILERPELMGFLALNGIKEKYAPWL